MKVVIGPYPDWIGPYQIAQKLMFWKDRDDKTVHKFGDWLALKSDGKTKTWLYKLCDWFEARRKRQVYVRIDKYDSWNCDNTLALIALPLLKQLRDTKHGYGLIDDADVPEHLRSTSATPLEEDCGGWDDLAGPRYDWFLNEVIWAMEQETTTDDTAQFYEHPPHTEGMDFVESIRAIKVDEAGLKAHEDRKQHAFTMFGKYFQTLWD